ncbi:MAG: hypothetical protein J6R47_04595 [Acholeplasmatales bacterium]|nr:hypothetical protein [Acholeplasmatales bacterium]
MIYRAIIEDIIDRYTAKVRIPLLHRAVVSSQYTELDSLPEARICTLPNTHPNIQKGDVVIVALENNDPTKPIIIGYLYKEILSSTSISSIFNSLEVKLETILSENTTIGEVTPDNIKQLIGCKENINQQFKQIRNRLDLIEKELSNKEQSNNS